MTKVRVGLVGCGFVAELHMYAYQRVYGLDARVTAVAARGDHVLDFAKKHQIRASHRDFRALLADKEIDVVDICTPPALHATMIVEATQAGKHIICEKPFTGYFGRGGDKAPIGKHVPKSLMYERVMEEMDKTCAAIKSSGRLFMYAEDWIYAPAVAKTVEILKATNEGGGEPQRVARRPCRPVVDDRRRLADPHGVSSAVGGALSQTGGGAFTRRADRGVGGDR